MVLYRRRLISKLLALSLCTSLPLNSLLAMQPQEPSSSSSSSSFKADVFPFGERLEDIDKVFEKAPQAVKSWAKELQTRDGKFRTLPYRLFLYGIPGVGKTCMALGIMKQNPDWEKVKIEAGQIKYGNRCGTAEELNRRLNQVTYDIEGNPEKKYIILIDEVSALMENYKNTAYDTKETTDALKAFINTHANNPNIMIIFTGNEITDMEKSMHERLSDCFVEILPPSEKELHEIFHFHAKKLAHETVPNELLSEVYKIADIKAGRGIQKFVNRLRNTICDLPEYTGNLGEYPLSQDLLIAVAHEHKKHALQDTKLTDREFAIQQNEKNEQANQKRHDEAMGYSKINARILVGGVIYEGAKQTKARYDEYVAKNKTHASAQSEPQAQPMSQPSAPQSSESSTSSQSTKTTAGDVAVGGIVVLGIANAAAAKASAATAAAAPAVAKAGNTLKTAITFMSNPYVMGATAIVTAGGSIWYYFKKSVTQTTQNDAQPTQPEHNNSNQ